MASLVNDLIAKLHESLKDEPKANGVLLRGFAKHPDMPPMPQVTQMRAGAFAVYPMYRGLAKLVGMTVTPGGGTPASQLDEAMSDSGTTSTSSSTTSSAPTAPAKTATSGPRWRRWRSSISLCRSIRDWTRTC